MSLLGYSIGGFCDNFSLNSSLNFSSGVFSFISSAETEFTMFSTDEAFEDGLFSLRSSTETEVSMFSTDELFEESSLTFSSAYLVFSTASL